MRAGCVAGRMERPCIVKPTFVQRGLHSFFLLFLCGWDSSLATCDEILQSCLSRSPYAMS